VFWDSTNGCYDLSRERKPQGRGGFAGEKRRVGKEKSITGTSAWDLPVTLVAKTAMEWQENTKEEGA